MTSKPHDWFPNMTQESGPNIPILDYTITAQKKGPKRAKKGLFGYVAGICTGSTESFILSLPLSYRLIGGAIRD